MEPDKQLSPAPDTRRLRPCGAVPLIPIDDPLCIERHEMMRLADDFEHLLRRNLAQLERFKESALSCSAPAASEPDSSVTPLLTMATQLEKRIRRLLESNDAPYFYCNDALESFDHRDNVIEHAPSLLSHLRALSHSLSEDIAQMHEYVSYLPPEPQRLLQADLDALVNFSAETESLLAQEAIGKKSDCFARRVREEGNKISAALS